MSAAGKKNRLKMKYPMKLWPLRRRRGRAGRLFCHVGRKYRYAGGSTCVCRDRGAARGWASTS
jgi:hypothetical protein